ncbi:MAG: hypothetical protein JW778_05705 [Candidatus Altiarchaeota archaeon]|nr:hypothetical protein [Candidatus Altiarchaeota archaeon]
MKLAEKNLGYYASNIKLPLLYYIIAVILAFIVAYILPLDLAWLLVLAVLLFGPILLPTYIGWSTVRKRGGALTHAALSGALLGVVLCSIFLILIILFAGISFTLFSGQSDTTGLSPETAEVVFLIDQLIYRVSMVMLGIAVIGFPFYAGAYTAISVTCAALGGLIAKKTM